MLFFVFERGGERDPFCIHALTGRVKIGVV